MGNPHTVFHSHPFRFLALAPTKLVLRRFLAPPAKRNVSDPRPLIPKREGAHKTVRRVRFQIRPRRPGSSWSSVNLWGKVERRSTQALSPGPSTTPQKAKNFDGLSFRPSGMALCILRHHFCVFLGGFSSCRHHRSRLQYGKTLQL